MKESVSQVAALWKTEMANAAPAQEQVQAEIAQGDGFSGRRHGRAASEIEARLMTISAEFSEGLKARSAGLQEKLTAWEGEMDGRVGRLESEMQARSARLEAELEGAASPERGESRGADGGGGDLQSIGHGSRRTKRR